MFLVGTSTAEAAAHVGRQREPNHCLTAQRRGFVRFVVHTFFCVAEARMLENETLASYPLSKITASGIGCLAYAESSIEEMLRCCTPPPEGA